MKRLRQLAGIACLNSKWIIRQPLWLMQGFFTVAGMSAIILIWGGAEALKNLTVAWIIAGAWSSGLNLVAQTIGWQRVYYEYERLTASPIPLSLYFIGVVIGHLPFFLLVDVAPAAVIGVFIGISPINLLVILSPSPIALTLGALTSLSVVLRLKNPTNISAITNPLSTLTTLLPPVYYPLKSLSPCFQLPLLIIPTVSLMELARWLIGYSYTRFNPFFPSLFLAAWIIIITPLTLRKMKWGLE